MEPGEEVPNMSWSPRKLVGNKWALEVETYIVETLGEATKERGKAVGNTENKYVGGVERDSTSVEDEIDSKHEVKKQQTVRRKKIMKRHKEKKWKKVKEKMKRRRKGVANNSHEEMEDIDEENEDLKDVAPNSTTRPRKDNIGATDLRSREVEPKARNAELDLCAKETCGPMTNKTCKVHARHKYGR